MTEQIDLSHLQALASKLSGHDVRIIWHRPEFGQAHRTDAYAPIGYHPQIREYFQSRGEWPAMWPLVIVFCKQFSHEYMRTLTVHELAHHLPFTPFADPDPSYTPTSGRLRLATDEAEILHREAARPPLPWDGHDDEFIRICLHLAWRAEQLGERISLHRLCAGFDYRLSGAEVYQEALGDEPTRLADYSFDELLTVSPPASFTEIFREDTELYFSKFPEERR